MFYKGRTKLSGILKTRAMSRIEDINSMGSVRESSLTLASSFTVKKSINAETKQIFTTVGNVQV